MLEVTDLGLQYQNQCIFQNLNFQLNNGEFLTILGPSGCGKSSILNLLTGIEKKETGTIQVNGEEITGLSDTFAYMPQEHLLIEWETVKENILLYQRIHGTKVSDEEVNQRLATFDLENTAQLLPYQLSGGMKQRVALLRTVMAEREILLLDEPFGALDVITRNMLQDWLVDLRKKMEKSILFVTHDIDEALYLSDRILVLSKAPAEIIYEIDFTGVEKSREWLSQQGHIRNEIYYRLKEQNKDD